MLKMEGLVDALDVNKLEGSLGPKLVLTVRGELPLRNAL